MISKMVIASVSGEGFWSNDDGWVSLSSATHFSGEEMIDLVTNVRMPITGMPVAIPAHYLINDEIINFFDRKHGG